MDDNGDPARVTLAIQRGGDAISGVLEEQTGRRYSFWGWLELITELEALRDRPDDPADTRSLACHRSGRRRIVGSAAACS